MHIAVSLLGIIFLCVLFRGVYRLGGHIGSHLYLNLADADHSEGQLG